MNQFENLFLDIRELTLVFECPSASTYYYLKEHNIIREERKKNKKKVSVTYSVLDLAKKLDKKPFKGYDGGKFLKKISEVIKQEKVKSEIKEDNNIEEENVELEPEEESIEENENEEEDEDTETTLGLRDQLDYDYATISFKGEYVGIMVSKSDVRKKIYVYKYASETYFIIEKIINYLESALIKLISVDSFKEAYPLPEYYWLTGGDNE